MRDYVKGMLDSFPIKFREGETATTPANEDLFGQKSSNDKKLQQDKAEAFHTTVAQGLFLTKRGARYTYRNCISMYKGTTT